MTDRTLYDGLVLDEERALYGQKHIYVRNCRFDGSADGESALKESDDILAEDDFFNLRYPFWHNDGVVIRRSEMTSLCRAALWYSKNITIEDSKLHGIKALRECRDAKINGCDIISPEFGWRTYGVEMHDTTAESEYFMFESRDLNFSNVTFKGKYSFQYVERAVFENCNFDTKDALWHAKDVIVRNSVIRGEYLSWYSDGLTLENCTIIGTQPLCYCRNLKLINCKMMDTDLAFEKSEVDATVTTPVISIKNPYSGCIRVPEVGELIMDDAMAKGEVIVG